MAKIQFINAYTHEILRDVEQSLNSIQEMIGHFKSSNGQELFLMNSSQKLFKANYVTDKMVIENGKDVHKVFFKVKVNDLQP